MKNIGKTVHLLVIAGALLLAAFAGAEEKKALYTWTDDQGVVHMTDTLQNVPQKYRSQTRVEEQAPGSSAGGAEQQEGNAPAAPAPTNAGASDDAQKAQWQSRMADAKRRLQFAEDQVRQLEKRKADISGKWGSSGAALPPQEALDEIKAIDQELASARQAVDDARNHINVVLPDEARKAGVPPGWLRD